MLPKDFPEWFAGFLEEQLAEVPTFREQPSYHIDNLSIAYIKLWSIYETYIKILQKLYEKRCALKEIDVKIQLSETAAKDIKNWTLEAKKVSAAYLTSMRSGKHIDIEDNIGKLTVNIKGITVSKYSVRKSDVALMALPNAKDIEKASVEFNLDGSEISHLLHPTNSESKFYKTRNIIAHEGKSDILLRNFILMRIDPLKEAVEAIKRYVDET